ncbi:hypothetical protein QGX12_gp085 [Pseudomonas phage Kremar]|uniref:Uncharacterized protein n=1 Tax=Pseudomonas phage Kremar TaxID=2928831 RepID=A0AAE9KEV0_9CAUD|nr:hypothetical protein QGX12_gp085 [Pseudomonas phage Kremar]UOL48559.1 hypothetical protein [Pseudomonas phage Kremar]
MLLIGSRALIRNNPELESQRKCVDWDFICTLDQFRQWHRHHKGRLQFAVPTQGGKYYHARDKDGMNYEFELAWPGTSAEILLNEYGANNWQIPVTASNHDLLLIKESHKYKRNSPHFLKTMQDIHFLRFKVNGGKPVKWIERNREILALREKESYDYAHPKLNVTSGEFFTGDGVNYIYDHDSIHETQALLWSDNGDTEWPRPAYTFYMKDGSEVMTSKEKFFSVEERIRLYGVYEESCVLALERSQIPHGLGKEGGPSARWSFEMALMKVCTSITSGWFREYAWENYQKVLDLYEEQGENGYIENFNSLKQLLKPYKGEQY